MSGGKPVLSLVDRLPVRASANPDLVEMLRRHLGMAERGEIVAAVVVAACADGVPALDISDDDFDSPAFHVLNSGLSIMQHRINEAG